MNRQIVVLVSSILFCGGLLTGAAASLKTGDAAPAMQVGKWIKGKPVDKLEASGVYVVEFWATWCPPCRKSIPHLTELAKKFQGKVQVIGVSVYEHEPTEEARLSKVSSFVKSMGDKMDYTVAVDDASKFMAKRWMEAADQNGIPTAFVVSKGKIAWIGHPMEGLEEELAKLTK